MEPKIYPCAARLGMQPGGRRSWGLPGKGLKIRGLALTEVWSQGGWGQAEL